MRKLLLMLCLLTASIAVQAQFEKGKWVFNPTVTGLDLSYTKQDKFSLGLEFLGGAFVVDNVALLINLGAKWTEWEDAYTAGVGGRYYFESIGLYLGGFLKYREIDRTGIEKKYTDFTLSPEFGYAFFVGRNITFEPVVYYDMSLKERGDNSRFGFKLGFGIYF